ncbi:MAG: hypothetical protein MRY79_08065 [Alphaproteobacteria bacterium]|nr:hypothetical protein [Alphaproteobacteria bacterium]
MNFERIQQLTVDFSRKAGKGALCVLGAGGLALGVAFGVAAVGLTAAGITPFFGVHILGGGGDGGILNYDGLFAGIGVTALLSVTSLSAGGWAIDRGRRPAPTQS